MLKTLSIQNYALIQELNINFELGFSTLTGETGAGKSILLGALSLILGNRADSNVLNNKEQKCVVEATFNIEAYNLKTFFDQNDLDFEPQTIIRREINANGKSRAFINDTPTNLNTLKELGSSLVDIHSQHENLELNNYQFQLNVLDAVSKNKQLLELYSEVYKSYKDLQQRLNQLNKLAEESSADLDYNNFQFNQLYELSLEKIDQQALEEELSALENAEIIQQNLSLAHELINGQELNISMQLVQIKQALEAIKKYYPNASNYIERIESARIDLNDISSEAEISAESITSDPEKSLQIKDALDKLYALMQKHKVDSVTGLIEVKNEFEKKILDQQNYAEDIIQVQANLDKAEKKLNEIANKLSESRNKNIKPLCHHIQKQLSDLGMKNAVLSIDIQSNNTFYFNGKDKVNFLFSANKNHELQNISKIASGGEISRLMLSIKSILSQSIALPTIIFDEIDTGVSGEIADKMADIMNLMADSMQVISITHLPQIAARGKNHYKVYKTETNNQTQTYIDKLNHNQRIEELARMLSGKDITTQAIENAKSLINNN